MDRNVVEELTVRFIGEQAELEQLQEKTVARLYYLQGALETLDEVRRSDARRSTETSRDGEEVKGSSEAEETEA